MQGRMGGCFRCGPSQFIVIFLFFVLEIKPRARHMLAKLPSTLLYLQPDSLTYFVIGHIGKSVTINFYFYLK